MSSSCRPEGDETFDFGLLTGAGGRSDVEVKAVLAELRHQRRATPGDHGTGEIGRTNGGLFVLIPDQWPSKRLAPEVTDRPRAVAVDRSQTWATREEVVVGLDDAELVAFGVGEHDMPIVGVLTDVDVMRAEADQPLDRFVLVIDRRGRQIEMKTVLTRLAIRDRLEEDPEAGAIRRL